MHLFNKLCLCAAVLGSFASSNFAAEVNDGNDYGSVDYLALGDSLPFGDNSFIPYTAEARPDPWAFVGFGDYVGRWGFGGRYRNLACPGESSASFIDNEALSMGCAAYKKAVGIKEAYAGSQLDATLELIRKNPQMRLITVTLGGNDNFLLIQKCVADHPEDQEAVGQCIQAGFPEMLERLESNLASILKSIRAAGFKGKLFFTTFFAKNYFDQASNNPAVIANLTLGKVALQNQARPIDLYVPIGARAVWKKGETCKTGYLIPNPNSAPHGSDPKLPCDDHYSDEGARFVAKLILLQSKI